MRREVGDIITVGNEEYTVLDSILYEGKDYLFTNLVKDEEPTEYFFIFEFIANEKNGIVKKVENEKLLERLIPICSGNIEKTIKVMNIQDKYEIN